MEQAELEQQVRARAAAWMQPPFDEETQAAVAELLARGGEELIDAFYTDLEFGTGGLRGVMGVGTNRMNAYTVGQASQGLARYVLAQIPADQAAIAIAHDSRLNSPEFARVAAEVFAAHGIKAYLYDGLRPTPQLSFTVRELGCTAGIVLTASHNPKEYNGYKVYWADGGQIVPPHDAGIITEVRAVALDEVQRAPDSVLIEQIGPALDAAFQSYVTGLRLDSDLIENGSDLKLVYTPLHGTGAVSVTPALRAAGFRAVSVVPEQAEPDGHFPTVHSPNPEEGAALSAAIALAQSTGAQLVLGTDPDSDRVGLAARTEAGDYRLLNGNETGALLVDYVLNGLERTGRMPAHPFVAKTIVTSELMAEIGRARGIEVVETLTGFKWIAAAIREREGQSTFVVGGEESYGYMIGDRVRDKDAVASACLLAEVAHACGGDLLGELRRIHQTYGAYREALVSQTLKGRAGKQAIADRMEGFRSQPPADLAGDRVVELRDYRERQVRDLVHGTNRPTAVPASNVIQFVTESGSIVTARPSGTEPKIKFYFSVRATAEAAQADYEGVMDQLGARIEALKAAFV